MFLRPVSAEIWSFKFEPLDKRSYNCWGFQELTSHFFYFSITLVPTPCRISGKESIRVIGIVPSTICVCIACSCTCTKCSYGGEEQVFVACTHVYFVILDWLTQNRHFLPQYSISGKHFYLDIDFLLLYMFWMISGVSIMQRVFASCSFAATTTTTTYFIFLVFRSLSLYRLLFIHDIVGAAVWITQEMAHFSFVLVPCNLMHNTRI